MNLILVWIDIADWRIPSKRGGDLINHQHFEIRFTVLIRATTNVNKMPRVF